MSGIVQVYLTGNGDSYAPVAEKPELQQYDNYQIYDLNCVDIVYQQTVSGVVSSTPIIDKFKSFLAVQAYNTESIHCDFNSIVNTYK